jgi:hypothetical protein
VAEEEEDSEEGVTAVLFRMTKEMSIFAYGGQLAGCMLICFRGLGAIVMELHVFRGQPVLLAGCLDQYSGGPRTSHGPSPVLSFIALQFSSPVAWLR